MDSSRESRVLNQVLSLLPVILTSLIREFQEERRGSKARAAVNEPESNVYKPIFIWENRKESTMLSILPKPYWIFRVIL